MDDSKEWRKTDDEDKSSQKWGKYDCLFKIWIPAQLFFVYFCFFLSLWVFCCPGDEHTAPVCLVFCLRRKRMCYKTAELPDWSAKFKGPGHKYRWLILKTAHYIYIGCFRIILTFLNSKRKIYLLLGRLKWKFSHPTTVKILQITLACNRNIEI